MMGRQLMESSLATALALGFVLGLRHALDADHIAAVSALVSQHRSLVRSCLLGTFWGAGHTAALLVAAIVVIAFKLTISPTLERGIEMAVALLLIFLGSHVILRAVGSWRLHRHVHFHDGHRHSHFHLHAQEKAEQAATGHSHGHRHLMRLAGRPFLVGLLHGTAGSAALMLLVLATIPSPVGGLLYVLVFGIGSTAGMLLLSGIIGMPFVVAGRSRAAVLSIQALAGAASLCLGGWLAWDLSGLG
jgi:ABC-type nickel/cobalt efflux system permease component RcnA